VSLGSTAFSSAISVFVKTKLDATVLRVVDECIARQDTDTVL